MKTRIVHTKFWNDGYVSELDHKQKLFFLYLITNDKVSISGMYELPDKNIRADLDLTQKEIDSYKEKLQKDGKFVFYKGWIRIMNVDDYNNYLGEKNYKAKQRELADAPKELKDTSIDTSILGFEKSHDTPSNNKSVISNNDKSVISNNDKEEDIVVPVKDEFKDFLELFNKLFKRTFMSTPARVDKFKIRRRVFSQEQILKAVTNMSKQPFFMGENDSKWKADPDYFLRSDEIIDKHLNASIDEHPGWTDEEWAILHAPLPKGAKEFMETGK